MKSIQGKVAAVTGAGSGMGREIALLCASRGAAVALADYREEPAEETGRLIRERGGSCSVHRVDVSSREEVARFAEEAVARHGAVDIVFNNAGIIPNFEHYDKSDYAVMEKMLAVNLWGVVHGTREFLPHLLTRPEAALVNTSSVSGLVAYMGMAPYVASKFAVRGFTEALRMEYLRSSVTISTVYPGAIATRIKENSPFYSEEEKRIARLQFEDGKTTKRLTPADKAARKIVDGMMAGKARIVIGADALVQDIAARFFPGAYAGFFYKALKHRLPD